MKEVDDTPVDESESEDFLAALAALVEEGRVRIVVLEHALALLAEDRVTVRAPEANDDPEWY